MTDATEVTLRQVCRWADEDDEAMSPWADVVLTQLSQALPARQLTLEEIRAALRDAGANLSQMRFVGSAACAVRRSEVDDATFAGGNVNIVAHSMGGLVVRAAMSPALDAQAPRPRVDHIVTLRGMGYRFDPTPECESTSGGPESA